MSRLPDPLGVVALLVGLAVAAWRLDARFDTIDGTRLAGGGDPWVVAEVRLTARLAAQRAGGGATEAGPALPLLARERMPPEIRDALVGATGLDAGTVGLLLLDDATLDGVLAACPATGGALCDPVTRARHAAAVDDALAGLLAGGEKEAAWTLALAERLGARGAAIATRASAKPTEDPLRRDATVLMLRARTVPPADAVALLRDQLLQPGPLGTVAVLEIARLRQHPAALEAFAEEHANTADAALATWAYASP